MDGLTEGCIVHFVQPDGSHRPAIVVKAYRNFDGATHSDGLSNLVVFVDGLNDGFPNTDPAIWKAKVLHSESMEAGTWHWIEKA